MSAALRTRAEELVFGNETVALDPAARARQVGRLMARRAPAVISIETRDGGTLCRFGRHRADVSLTSGQMEALAPLLDNPRMALGPLAVMLGSKRRNATVTLAHSRTRDLAELCRRADILVAAIGRAAMITPDFVKPGATVIDVGINRTDDGIVGDVDFDAVSAVAGAITPVPGGVGRMTIAMLMANTVTAARLHL